MAFALFGFKTVAFFVEGGHTSWILQTVLE